MALKKWLKMPAHLVYLLYLLPWVVVKSRCSAYVLPGFHAPVVKLSTGYPFPYIYDETQEVAHAYKAAYKAHCVSPYLTAPCTCMSYVERACLLVYRLLFS